MALGTRLVRSIATCLSVQSLFDERKATRTVDLSAFWSHSLLVAELSRSLATATGYHRPDEAYLAGLLHDVGELLLLSALGEPYLQVLAVCSGEAALAEMETENFGVHHGEVGTWLADQWHLDSPFADGILFHHLPAEQILTAAPLPQVVWLAHVLAGDNGVPEELAQVAGQMFADIDKARLSTLCDQAEQRMCVIADAIGIRLRTGRLLAVRSDCRGCAACGRTPKPPPGPTRRYPRQQGLAAAPAARTSSRSMTPPNCSSPCASPYASCSI
jgi:HD superfamily phosphohydrolase YqeK